MDSLNPHLLDLACLAVSLTLFTLYNLYMARRFRTDPNSTIQGAMDLARRAWVVGVMEDKKDILAVQTLRNSTMAATFLASTAVLLSVGVLSLTAQAEHIGSVWHALNLFGSTQQSTLSLKLLVLLIDLFIAFFCFSSSIRLYNHVGFLINAPCVDGNPGSSLTFVALELNKAANHFHLGMRAYYYMVPLIFWLFGPLLLLGATAAIVVVVYRLDRAPRLRGGYVDKPFTLKAGDIERRAGKS